MLNQCEYEQAEEKANKLEILAADLGNGLPRDMRKRIYLLLARVKISLMSWREQTKGIPKDLSQVERLIRNEFPILALVWQL